MTREQYIAFDAFRNEFKAKIKAEKTTYARCAGRKLQIYLQWSGQRNPKQLIRAQIAVQNFNSFF